MSLSLKVRAITFFVCLCVHNLKVQVFSGTIAAPEMPIFFLLSSEKKKKNTYIKENAQIQREHEKNAFENYRHATLSDTRRQKKQHWWTQYREFKVKGVSISEAHKLCRAKSGEVSWKTKSKFGICTSLAGQSSSFECPFCNRLFILRPLPIKDIKEIKMRLKPSYQLEDPRLFSIKFLKTCHCAALFTNLGGQKNFLHLSP